MFMNLSINPGVICGTQYSGTLWFVSLPQLLPSSLILAFGKLINQDRFIFYFRFPFWFESSGYTAILYLRVLQL
jgi:hypothetical protein